MIQIKEDFNRNIFNDLDFTANTNWTACRNSSNSEYNKVAAVTYKSLEGNLYFNEFTGVLNTNAIKFDMNYIKSHLIEVDFDKPTYDISAIQGDLVVWKNTEILFRVPIKIQNRYPDDETNYYATIKFYVERGLAMLQNYLTNLEFDVDDAMFEIIDNRTGNKETVGADYVNQVANTWKRMDTTRLNDFKRSANVGDTATIGYYTITRIS